MNDQAPDDLRDIHPFQSIIVPDYVWWVLLVILVVALSFLIYKYVISRKKVKILSVYEKTILEIDALDLQKDSKLFYLEYSDIVRAYLLERVKLNLFDKTLNELRFLLDNIEVFDLQSKNQLLNIFAKADMAKFARENVSKEKREEHLENTKEILSKVEDKLNEKEKSKYIDDVEILDTETQGAKLA